MKANLKRLFREEFNNFLVLSLLTTLIGLGVVTAIPAFVALLGTFIKILDETCDISRVREYLALFKKKFKRALGLELVMAAYGAMLVWVDTLASRLNNEGLTILVYLFGFLASVVAVCAMCILAGTETKLGDAIWNGVCLGFGRFPRAALAGLWVAGSVVLTLWLFPISLIVMAALGVSNAAAMAVCFLWQPLDEFVLNPGDYE